MIDRSIPLEITISSPREEKSSEERRGEETRAARELFPRVSARFSCYVTREREINKGHGKFPGIVVESARRPSFLVRITNEFRRMKNYEIFFESISCLLRPSIPRGWITDGGSRRIDAAAKQPERCKNLASLWKIRVIRAGKYNREKRRCLCRGDRLTAGNKGEARMESMVSLRVAHAI